MHVGVMESKVPSDTPASIGEADETGFDGIELDINGPDPGDDLVWSPAGRTIIRGEIVDRGIELPSICLGFLNRGGLTMDDEDTRGDARHAILRAIDAAAAIRADVILVPFFGTGEIESDVHRRRVIEGISRVAPAAEAAGVTLAIENTRPAEENLELIESIDSPAVGVYYDVGNVIPLGYDPASEIETLGGAIAQVHFKDRDRDGSDHLLGEGEVDFDACVDALEAIGYDEWVVLETGAHGDPLQDLVRNREFTERVCAGSA